LKCPESVNPNSASFFLTLVLTFAKIGALMRESVRRGGRITRRELVFQLLRVKKVSGSCEKIGCHAERSEASAFIFLKTNDCRFFAALRMTGVVDFFTRT
jgi:hypothetical protein